MVQRYRITRSDKERKDLEALHENGGLDKGHVHHEKSLDTTV